MRRNKIIILILVSILFLGGSVQASQYTMSWSFRTFNNPNARQVAINLAEKQAGMVEETEDPIERFKESFERRLMSNMQQGLIEQITGEESVEEGSYQIGDLDISVSEDPATGDVTLTITDLNTGETSVVTYSSDDYYY
ncbi:MAG: curli assembly protein CsgF [Halanaerobiales bacterium]|nr:curli assembly protein CsgF [Halanaerobiales bacterium]